MEFIHPIKEPARITECYGKLEEVLGGFYPDQLRVKKKAGWIAVPAENSFYEEEVEERFLQTALKYGYREVSAVAWERLGDFSSAFVVPTTAEAIEEFNRKCGIFWFVLFAGKPDWFILLPREEYMIVAGEPELVVQILGCEVAESFTQMREFIKSDWLNVGERKHIGNIIEQLQFAYPKAAPGEVVWL